MAFQVLAEWKELRKSEWAEDTRTLELACSVSWVGYERAVRRIDRLYDYLIDRFENDLEDLTTRSEFHAKLVREHVPSMKDWRQLTVSLVVRGDNVHAEASAEEVAPGPASVAPETGGKQPSKRRSTKAKPHSEVVPNAKSFGLQTEMFEDASEDSSQLQTPSRASCSSAVPPMPPRQHPSRRTKGSITRPGDNRLKEFPIFTDEGMFDDAVEKEKNEKDEKSNGSKSKTKKKKKKTTK